MAPRRTPDPALMKAALLSLGSAHLDSLGFDLTTRQLEIVYTRFAESLSVGAHLVFGSYTLESLGEKWESAARLSGFSPTPEASEGA